MLVIDQFLLDKMGIDDAEVRLRTKLLGFGEEEQTQLKRAAEYVHPVVPIMVEEFFHTLKNRNEISRFSLDDDAIQQLRGQIQS